MSHRDREHPHPKFQVEPPPDVRREIEKHNTSTSNLIQEAVLMVRDSGGLEAAGPNSAVARLFVERGYSDTFANWIAKEAAERVRQGVGQA